MRGLILALIPPAVTFLAFDAAKLRINTSGSLPVGLYRVAPTGAFVEF